MPEMVLFNPGPKRKRRTGSKKRKTRRATGFAVVKRAVHRKRRRTVSANPAPHRARRSVRHVVRRARRRVGVAGRRMSMNNIVSMLKDAAIGGGGALTVDIIMDKLYTVLPASMQPTDANAVQMADAIKIIATVLMGEGLAKPTKGLSRKMASGSLVVQAYQLLGIMAAQYMPGAAPAVAGMRGLGYRSPVPVGRGNLRINRMFSPQNMNGFVNANTTLSGFAPMNTTLSSTRTARGSVRYGR